MPGFWTYKTYHQSTTPLGAGVHAYASHHAVQTHLLMATIGLALAGIYGDISPWPSYLAVIAALVAGDPLAWNRLHRGAARISSGAVARNMPCARRQRAA